MLFIWVYNNLCYWFKDLIFVVECFDNWIVIFEVNSWYCVVDKCFVSKCEYIRVWGG